MELESVEDTFLDPGQDVACQTARCNHLVDTNTNRLVDSVGWVYKDTAWFELGVVNKKCQGKQVWTAAPIALQIQVGEVSWESSLIKSVPSKSPDLVTLTFSLHGGTKAYNDCKVIY